MTADRPDLRDDERVRVERDERGVSRDESREESRDEARDEAPGALAGAAIGVDLGERRIGIALAEAGAWFASPLATLQRSRDASDDAAVIARLIDRHRATTVVVGLPYDASGGEGVQAALTRTWVAAITPLLPAGVTVMLQDERLTSHLAEQRLGPMPRGRSGGPPSRTQRDAYRARVDREAAAIILQDALDTRRGPRSSSSRPPSRTMETPA